MMCETWILRDYMLGKNNEWRALHILLLRIYTCTIAFLCPRIVEMLFIYMRNPIYVCTNSTSIARFNCLNIYKHISICVPTWIDMLLSHFCLFLIKRSVVGLSKRCVCFFRWLFYFDHQQWTIVCAYYKVYFFLENQRFFCTSFCVFSFV